MTAIVYTASASMPSSCKGHYRIVRVIDVPYWLANQKGWRPHAVTSKDVLRIIRDLGPQSVGKTDRCAYAKAIKRAEALAYEYNNSRSMAEAEQLISTGSA
jgi:hypothetical protein